MGCGEHRSYALDKSAARRRSEATCVQLLGVARAQALGARACWGAESTATRAPRRMLCAPPGWSDLCPASRCSTCVGDKSP